MFLITLIGLVLLSVTNIYLPYRPARDEAVNEVLALDQVNWILNDQVYTSATTRIVFVTSEVPHSQLVVAAYDNLQNQAVTNRCVSARYVTRHLLSGFRMYSAPGMCRPTPTDSETPDIVVMEHQERGTYILIGMADNDHIAYVQATWTDNSVETLSLHNNAFAFFRADLDSSVEWVVGLDRQKQILPETMVFNAGNTVTLFDYERFRQIITQDGIIIMGAYFSKSMMPRQCLQLTYLTFENAERYLTGKEAFIGQGICVSTNGADRLPAVITFIDGNTVVGGLVLDNTVTQIQLDWADGLRQVVPVVDGFYFAERTGTSVSVVTPGRLSEK